MTDPRDLIKRLADDLERITEELVIPEYAHTEKERTDASLALVAEARAYLAQPEPTLTVEDCDNMHKHRFNFLYEDFTGEIVLDGSFTREDLIEIANTVPPTKA